VRSPQSPPPLQDIIDRRLQKNFALELFQKAKEPGGKYLHWDDLRRYPAPDGLEHELWWALLKLKRFATAKSLKAPGATFVLTQPDEALEMLRIVDQQCAGQIGIGFKGLDDAHKRRFIMSALREEAIESSLIEGAATSRVVAKEMLRTGRTPNTTGERMILNNFVAMQHVSERRNERVTPQGVLELHRVLTQDTLRSHDVEGRFQTVDDERVVVIDRRDDTVLYRPPPANETPAQIEALCAFANGETPAWWLHPATRAMVAHYWLAWLHPFEDGNGRTARALFYWVMLRNDYWVVEFLPISRLIRAAPSKYIRAFLLCESDDNDITYFVLYHLRVLKRALDAFQEYVSRKVKEIRTTEQQLRIHGLLNHRQMALIQHAIRHKDAMYTVESHRNSHGVVYATARADLLDLVDKMILRKSKIERRHVFTTVADLPNALATLSEI
jgi:Fic family protein